MDNLAHNQALAPAFQDDELVPALPTGRLNLREALRVWYLEYGCHLESSKVLLNQIKPIVHKPG